jgi:YidC/Oxa1 family membrane protein insertase
LQPGDSTSYRMVIYGGPKLPELLDAVSLDGQSVGLSTSIDYTLESLARPMLWLLRQMYGMTGNWAIAIILLTLLVKLLLLYPSHRSMQSMKAMGQLKPQIDALRDKCGDDKQKFNMEMMALYKKHNINPVGGCLPILLQMPIYFALYSMLGNAVELYRVRLFWIPDLTAADPYFVLPLVTGALMYIQSKVLSPAPVDPQQKAMTSMMPVMFTVFTIFVPAGLTLYIMTNTILGMIQQAVINRGQKQNPPAPAPTSAKATSK